MNVSVLRKQTFILFDLLTLCTLRGALLIVRARCLGLTRGLSVLIPAALKPACNTSSSRQHSPLVCDGFRDCEDGRDEQNCTQSEEGSSALCCSSYKTVLNPNQNTSVVLG